MGLDIRVYKSLEPVDQDQLYREILWRNGENDDELHADALEAGYFYARVNSYFSSQADNLRTGWYNPGGFWSFSFGSYSYNQYREKLTRMALGVAPEVVWDSLANDDSSPFKDKPFVEQINFSDCEGIIGPETSAKLAKDYDEWMAMAENTLDEWDIQVYKNFARAFKDASEAGAVDFH